MTGVPRAARWCALSLLSLVFLGGLLANWLVPHGYAEQSREYSNAAPSRQFPLGTDDLGRDRFSRLVYGTRVSLLLAPAAAVLSVLIAMLAGGVAACAGRWPERISTVFTDLMLAVPSILIVFMVRAALPLNVSAWTSILITCGLLGALNWGSAARVIRAQVRTSLNSDFVLQARATGQSTIRILWKQVAPNFRPVVVAQFWILIPVFILSEANLSLLGLGVMEPMPSWGNMLCELENYAAVPERPWMLAPLAVLVLTIVSLYAVLPSGDEA